MVELDQIFVEEKQLGLNLCNKPAVFGTQNKLVFVIAGKNILAFNTKNGKRVAILKYPEQQLALLALENKDKIDYAYTTTDGFYCVSVKEKKATIIRKLILTPEGNVDSFLKVGEIPQAITNPKHLAITDLFAVIVSSRVRLECHPFDNYKVKASNYVCHGYFQNLEKQTLLSFDQVIFVNGVLYASLNTGRIYYWKKFAQTGFDPSSISHFHRNQSAAAFAIGAHGALYCGGGEASVRKWNLASTGAGRWQSAENVEKFDAPINEISLSTDGTLLAVQLEDNTVWIIQTSTMTILCELQTMQWMPNGHWLPLKVDPVRPDLIMTSGRIGHLQWFDPTKWRTVAFFDITEEDTPPRDNIPYGLIHDWLNIYEVNASPSTLVTVERRRRSKDIPSLLKFFRRNPKASLADLKIEDSIEFSGEVFRILSSHDDLSVDEAFAAIKEEEIVTIEKSGKITVFIRDVERSGRWLQDMSRTVDWMDSKIGAVSSVRRNCFAAVHKVENKTGIGNYILIWRLDDLSIHETIDSLQNVTAVEWAPYTPETENVLLTVTFKSISAYNVASKTVLWVIAVPQVKLFASLDICCCYVKNRVYVVDALTGDLKMQTEFEEPKKEVVATVSGKNVRFIGKSSSTRLSLLKIENAENEADREVIAMVKKTPFAELIEQARELEQAYKKIQTFKAPSFKQHFEGAIYTSAPLTKIGPEYIRQCLIKRDPLDFEF
uniref:Uncharacterized protein n=1 Tax=Panagrolaimus sp. PS1159 TaxID=55785 RepID=A0AC35G2M5_9BILA